MINLPGLFPRYGIRTFRPFSASVHREPLKGFVAECQSERTNHIRLDRIENNDGVKILHEVPYALLIESNVPVVCQHSRMDVSQAEMTLMTTMAY